MGHQELVYDLVGMVMVDHQHLQAVNLGLAHGGNILLGRAVVHQNDQRHLLTVPALILQGKCQVLGYILQLVKWGFAGGAAVVVVLGIRAADLGNQGKDGHLNGHCSGNTISVGMMADHNGPGLEDGAADLFGHRLHRRTQPVQDLAFDQKLRLGRLGPEVNGLLYLVFNYRGIASPEAFHGFYLHLNLVVAQADLADDPDHHIAINISVRSHSGPFEGSAEDQAAVVGQGEDGRTAGLLDLDHLSLDHDRLAHLAVQIRCLG